MHGIVATGNQKRLPIRLAVILLIAGTVAGVGSIRTATGPADGTALQNIATTLPSSRPATVRLATFNIHSGQPESGSEDLNLTAQTLQGFDIAGLNEVRGTFFTDSPTQAQQLGQKLGTTYLFLPTERQFWHEAFGNAVVSRIPVRSWHRRPLASPTGGSRRNVTILTLDNGLTVLITHVARNDDQTTQLRELATLFLSQKEPCVLMGDLNVKGDNPDLASLLARPGVRSPLDEKTRLKGNHIDWILVRGAEIRDAGQRDLGASDHPLVWAEIVLP